MSKTIFTLLLGWLFMSTALAQNTNYLPNQFLVQLAQHKSIKHLQQELTQRYPTINWEAPKRLIPKMEIWQLQYTGQANQAAILAFLQTSKTVTTAQYNHKVTLRSPMSTTPNDPSFNNQWQYLNTGLGGGTAGVDLDADQAWDITTGGLTADNDTIVIAVLDNGVSPSQSDFGDNLWVNHGEIPNNHIDDDGNGYEDDYRGWNSNTNSDLINGGGHGTSVAGIIGAQGNNNNGVTGVNWNVKLMIIHNNWNATEANVLAAYGYALTQRKIYNQTNGAQGAYVVATNASWGINQGQPSSAPLWCSFYDTLGHYGIINVAATANANTDVDLLGDLPTACPSDYLIAVTNVNKLGNKELGAAYGTNSIDLGAFGSGVYTTTSPNGFGVFGGTSAAAPHVAGAVGLLYSGACNNFVTYSKVHPDSAALKMKQYILDGTVPIADLNGTTVSGGYLNLYRSLLQCISDCPTHTCFSPYSIVTSNITDTQAQLDWVLPSTTPQIEYRYRVQGGTWTAFTALAQGQTNLVLNNLLSCTDYEIELRPSCNGAMGTSIVQTIKTDGCCEAPTGFSILTRKEDSALVAWPNVLIAQSYLVYYREMGTTTWQVVPTSTNTNLWLTNLTPCTSYEAEVKTICSTGDTTSLSNHNSVFITTGCQSCTLIGYCAASGTNSANDWIDTFTLDGYVNASGNNNGYALFDNTNILLGAGDFHRMSVSQGKNFTEIVTIWLDINQDGDFLDANEELNTYSMAVTDKTKNGSFIVPITSLLGTTRLRVAMRWKNSITSPCGNIDYGEIEDYCVQVINGNSIDAIPQNISDVYVFPNPFTNTINVQLNLQQVSNLDLQIYNTAGQIVHQQEFNHLAIGQHQKVLSPKLSNGVYFLRMTDNQQTITKRIVKINP